MLSEITPSSFALAIILNDTSKLTKIPGIGTKTAARIVLELKDKLKSEEISQTEENIAAETKNNDKKTEAVSALQVLGYTKREIEKALEQVDVSELQIEDIIKSALKKLSR